MFRGRGGRRRRDCPAWPVSHQEVVWRPPPRRPTAGGHLAYARRKLRPPCPHVRRPNNTCPIAGLFRIPFHVHIWARSYDQDEVDLLIYPNTVLGVNECTQLIHSLTHLSKVVLDQVASLCYHSDIERRSSHLQTFVILTITHILHRCGTRVSTTKSDYCMFVKNERVTHTLFLIGHLYSIGVWSGEDQRTYARKTQV